MKRTYYGTTALLILLLALAGVVYTLSPRLHAQSPDYSPWHTFTEEDGLPSSSVVASLRASDGALWFGASHGLVRFDGIWEIFTSANAPLPTGHITGIAEGPPGTLWFGSRDGDLVRFVAGQWHAMPGLEREIRDMHVVGEELWVATHNGLWRRTRDEWQPLRALDGHEVNAIAASLDGDVWLATSAGAFWLHNGQWRHYRKQDGLPHDYVSAVTIAPSGDVWFGTHDGPGVFKRETARWGTLDLQCVADQPCQVWSILVDDAGELWVGTNGSGLFRWDGLNVTQYRASGTPALGLLPQARQADSLANPFVRTLVQDVDGSLWIGTPGGLSRFQHRLWRSYVNPDRPSVNRINALWVDSAGILWAATDGAGLRRFDGEHWQQITMDEGLPSDYLLTVAEDHDRTLWVGTAGAGAAWHDGLRWQTLDGQDELDAAVVTAIAPHYGGGIWLGTTTGAYTVSQDRQRNDEVEALRGLQITAIWSSPTGAVWFGTGGAGTWRLADGEWTQFLRSAELEDLPLGAHVAAHAIVGDEQGKVWIGTWPTGLGHFDGERWRQISEEGRMPTAGVRSVFLDREDSLWVGTASGVSRTDGRSWVTYRSQDGLVAPDVRAIAQTPDGAMWFGTPNGLTRFLPETTPPIFRLTAIDGQPVQDAENLVFTMGEMPQLEFEAGDLQTPLRDLRYFYRITPVEAPEPGPWKDTAIPSWRLQLHTVGEFVLEAMARDRAFNYSESVVLRYRVIEANPVLHLPLLGPTSRAAVSAGFALTLIAVLGIAYASLVIYQTRRRPQIALQRKFNPFVAGEPVRREDMFFGREQLLRNILHSLHQNNIMVHGERRIGKTSLLYQLASRLRATEDPDYRFFPVYIDLEGTRQELFFYTLMEEISSMTRHESVKLADLRFDKVRPEVYTDRDFSRDLRVAIDALQRSTTRSVRIVLLLDEVDVLNNYDTVAQQQLRRVFMASFGQHLAAVVAGVAINKAWERVESPWYNLFNELRLMPFSRSEAEALICEPVKGSYTCDHDAVDFIIDHGHGRPHRIQQHCLNAVNVMLAAGRTRVTLADAEAALEMMDASDDHQPETNPTDEHTQTNMLPALEKEA